MSTPIDQAVQVTGWDKSVIAFLYDEFVQTDEDDFLDYVAEYVADAAFVIAAVNGRSIDGCIAAYTEGRASVLDPNYDPTHARDRIEQAGTEPEPGDWPTDDGYDLGSLPDDDGELFGGVPPLHDV